MPARRYCFCRIGGIVSIEKGIVSVARAIINLIEKNNSLSSDLFDVIFTFGARELHLKIGKIKVWSSI